MVRYDLKILNGLVDSYENSLLSRGENKVAVHIFFPFTEKTMPEYFNESSLAYEEIHASLKELERKEFLEIGWKMGKTDHIVEKVILKVEALDRIYAYLARVPKAELEEYNRKLLESWKQSSCPVTSAFASYLYERISEGKSVREYIDLSDMEKTEFLLSAISTIEQNQEPCYIREFSIDHFRDSKKLESVFGLLGKVFRRFAPAFAELELDAILAEYCIYHTPDYVYCKGEGVLKMEGQTLELSSLSQGIGLSGADLDRIRICGNNKVRKVITIENLTTFFEWKEKESLIIYLGGYHNRVRRQLLEMIYQEIPDAQYLHFGDIDVGGFEIYRDLCEKTGIPFQTYRMGVKELEHYRDFTKKLTDNDRRRLERLMGKEKDSGCMEVLEYMRDHGVKLEQEAIRVTVHW